MKSSFNQDALGSYAMWLDNILLARAEAFVNKYDLRLVKYDDERLPAGFVCYGSAFKEWAIDEGIQGAFIAEYATYFGNNGDQLNIENFIIDYTNGRIIFEVDPGYDWISASAISVKEVNVYTTNLTEEELITETMKNKLENGLYQVDYDEEDFEPAPPYDPSIPALFISIEQSENEPFALGGLDKTMLKAKAVVFTKEDYELDCILGYVSDSVRTCMPVLSFEDLPFNEWGDRKYSYNYEELKVLKGLNLLEVDSIISSKMKDVVRKKVAPNFYVGFLDVEFSIPRYPRG